MYVGKLALEYRRIWAFSGACALVAVAGCGASDEAPSVEGYPVTVQNCGVDIEVQARPETIVTVGQVPTEIVLALGAEDRLAGVADVTEPLPDTWQDSFEAVPEHFESDPSADQLTEIGTDFFYTGTFLSFGANQAGDRAEWVDRDVVTYISPGYCTVDRTEVTESFETVWAEISEIGTILGEQEAADELRSDQQGQLDELTAQAPGTGVDLLWFSGLVTDESGSESVHVLGSFSGAQLITDATGAVNIFAGLEQPSDLVSLDEVVAANPDVIALPTHANMPESELIADLTGHPVLGQLEAVRSESFVTIPYSEHTPGPRLVDGAVSLGQQLADR